MRRTFVVVVLLSLAHARPAACEPDRAVVGAILGAAAGLVIGNNVSGISQDVAAPVLAVAGGWLGYEMDRAERREHRARRAAPGTPGPRTRRPSPAAPARFPIPNRQPGVDLIKISVQMSNGVSVDVPILRLPDKYVGPRGEAYDTLPTSATLKKKYGL